MTGLCSHLPHLLLYSTVALLLKNEEKSMKKLSVILIALAITLSVVVAFAASSNPAPSDLLITTSEGSVLSLSDLLEHRELVILNIFQPGQATSSLELPWFDDVYEDLDDRVAIVAASPSSTDLDALSSYKASLESYTLLIRDGGNQPVPGVVLNFYGDGTSQMLTSDQDGVVFFTAKPATYHFQILNVPEGYEVDSGFEGTVKDWTMVEV